ncbi:hypothetical protein [Gordonia aichiensis]
MSTPGSTQLFLGEPRNVSQRDELGQKHLIGLCEISRKVCFGGVLPQAELLGKFLEDSHAVEDNLYLLSV